MENGRKIRVLLVDDELNFRQMTKFVLERRGFVVATAAGGYEAVDQVKKYPPDVVVMDIKMPGKDGMETFADIKKDTPDLPVIALTGYWREVSGKNGFHSILLKPCSLDLLADKIKEAAASVLPQTAEPLVRNLMIPLNTFNRVRKDSIVREAVNELFESLYRHREYVSVTDAVHRAVLVVDASDRIVGIVSFRTLLDQMYGKYREMIKGRPVELNSVTIPPPEFPGLFKELVREIHDLRVEDVMPEMPTVGANESLVAAMKKMVEGNHRRLIVMNDGNPVGIIREQNLFFEIAKIYGQKL